MTKLIDHHGVYLLAQPRINWDELRIYFRDMGWSQDWFDRMPFSRIEDEGVDGDRAIGLSDIEVIEEFAGRRCYRSFGTGDNPNVTRVREDSEAWYDNLKTVRHGNVLEHGMFTFVFEGVSRVFTHELVRHRVGVGISQESMRFVRLSDIPMWFPEWAREDNTLMERCLGVLEVLENHQGWLAEHFGLEGRCEPCGGSGWEGGSKDPFSRPKPAEGDPGACGVCKGSGRVQLDNEFAMKKHYTSFMRRFAPEGVGTGMVWSANARIARWVIQQRTEEGAEEEIRVVFDQVAEILTEQFPLLFGDFRKNDKGEWVTEYRKV